MRAVGSGSASESRAARVEIIYYPKKPQAPRAKSPSKRLTIETEAAEPGELPSRELVSHPGGAGGDPAAPRHSASKPEDDGGAARARGKTLTDEALDPAEVAFADLTRLGHEAFEAGRVDEARVVFESLVRLGHEHAFLHTMLGTIALGSQQLDVAWSEFDRALRLDPDDLAALVYRGEISVTKKKWAAAGDDLERALGLAPEDDPFVRRAKKLLKLVRPNR